MSSTSEGARPDDPSISDDAELWRRIPPKWIVRDENRGRHRPTSAAFGNDRHGGPMSVFLAAIMSEAGRGPDDALTGHEGYFPAAFTAGFARSQAQSVVHDPLPEEPAHGLVCGKKSKRVRTAFAKAAKWVRGPDGLQRPLER